MKTMDNMEIRAGTGENACIGADGLRICTVCGEPMEAYYPDGPVYGRDRHPVDCACRRAERECEEAERRWKEHQAAVERLRAGCFAFPLMRSWTFEADTQHSSQSEICRRYAEHWQEIREKNSGLLLWGDVGTGKSFLAACIANALIEQEVAVRMISLGEVIDYGFEGRSEYIRKLCSFPLLILDDFGMERNTKFGLETVCRVIDGRVMAGKPLIITTNLTLTELKEPEDTDRARIYDRVLSVTAPVRFEGESLRRKGQQEKLAMVKNLLKGKENTRES